MKDTLFSCDPIEEVLAELAQGKMILLLDHPDRENEADLMLPAQFASQKNINFMLKQACGLLCLALPYEHVQKLQLPLMVPENLNHTKTKTAFTVTIEASSGIESGVSAKDRATTISCAVSDEFRSGDLISPGHVFPLRAAQGGIHERAGHTEASLEFCHQAGLKKAAVLCEVLNEHGDVARGEDLQNFARQHGLKISSVEDLKSYMASVKPGSSISQEPWTALAN